jgi:hypothetical protein
MEGAASGVLGAGRERSIWPGGEEIYCSCWPCRQAAMAFLGGGGEGGGEQEQDTGKRNMMTSSDREKISLNVENQSNVNYTPDNFVNENDGKHVEDMSESKDLSPACELPSQHHSHIYDQGVNAFFPGWFPYSIYIPYSIQSSFSLSLPLPPPLNCPLTQISVQTFFPTFLLLPHLPPCFF